MDEMKSNVDRLYAALREMAANFEFKPDERINESVLASRLNASRTPIREALNRLVAENFLTFQSGRGFSCRSLSPKRIQDMYEARAAVECEAVRLSCERASKADIAGVHDYLSTIEPEYESCTDPVELLAMDEAFHMKLVRLSGNDELERLLKNLNDRIRYVRMINLGTMRARKTDKDNDKTWLSAHRLVLEAVERRDIEAAVSALRGHIERRREETTEAVRIAYSQLYVPVD